MKHLRSSVLLSAILAASHVSAWGINCLGSSQCMGVKDTVGILQDYVSGTFSRSNKTYTATDEQNIACAPGFQNSVCMWVSNGDNNDKYKSPAHVDAASVPLLLDALANHGCKGCGSIPLGYLNGSADFNSPVWGVLKVNSVQSPDCPGMPGIC